MKPVPGAKNVVAENPRFTEFPNKPAPVVSDCELVVLILGIFRLFSLRRVV